MKIRVHCRACGIVKPPADFNVFKTGGKTYVRPDCRECRAMQRRLYRAKARHERGRSA